MASIKKQIPKFRSEEDERKFWAKILANKRDVPYQSLLKVFLAERLEKERRP
jgi:hypothetical protein